LLNTAIQGDVELVDIVKQNLTNNQKILQDRLVSSKVINTQTQERLSEIDESFFNRQSVFAQRKHLQANILSLPILPTTTIGSYPQTSEIRKQRFLFNRGEVSWKDYDLFLKKEIENVIRVQEDLGLDILVHGEPERTDMVEYFAEQMDGFALTQHGWVQSYGSRAVRPPIIYGDISRYAPMTVACAQYAQSLTQKPIKGMLTGPITILQWSFVRNDQPRELTCKQIALALRDEVQDLEAGGINIIQIDEPALREGLPLRKAQREAYLNWAVQCFRLVSGVVSDQTQIHTHMCYAEFSEIITAITQMDADVISIEASRSNMELLDAFRQHQYPNDIGPGIYDIHSPRIPTIEEFVTLIHKALQVIPAERLWINPDCGLKTRKWDEVLPSLANLVEATRQVRRTIVK